MRLGIGLTPKQVSDTLGMPARDVVTALAAAYSSGYVLVTDSVSGRPASITFDGHYASGTAEFHAGTALYTVRR